MRVEGRRVSRGGCASGIKWNPELSRYLPCGTGGRHEGWLSWVWGKGNCQQSCGKRETPSTTERRLAETAPPFIALVSAATRFPVAALVMAPAGVPALPCRGGCARLERSVDYCGKCACANCKARHRMQRHPGRSLQAHACLATSPGAARARFASFPRYSSGFRSGVLVHGF